MTFYNNDSECFTDWDTRKSTYKDLDSDVCMECQANQVVYNCGACPYYGEPYEEVQGV